MKACIRKLRETKTEEFFVTRPSCFSSEISEKSENSCIILPIGNSSTVFNPVDEWSLPANSDNTSLQKENLDAQLQHIRHQKHVDFTSHNVPRNDGECSISDEKWPVNTLLCISDSIMNQIDEKRLSRNRINVKVRAFGGSKIEDMYDFLIPFLKKEPRYILLHVGTNDAPYKSPDRILNELILLKQYVEKFLPGSTVIISQPIVRYDDPRASLTIVNLLRKMAALNVKIMDNSNITDIHLGKKGLNLNGKGNGRLALNIISLIREL